MQGGNEVTTNHGTHIAGIIAAEHHDQSIQQGYVQGVAPGAKILPSTLLTRMLVPQSMMLFRH